MLRLEITSIVLLLFYDVLFTEAVYNSQQNTNLFINLINNKGWMHLNSVEKIDFRAKQYTPEEIFKSPKRGNSSLKVRTTTILLGCLYAKDFQKLFYVIHKYYLHCVDLMNTDSAIWWSCTRDYLKVVSDLKPFASMIIESLFAVEALHFFPMKITGRQRYKFYETLINLIDVQNKIKKNSLSRNNLSISLKSLKRIDNFLHESKLEIDELMEQYCKTVPYDLDLEWEKLEKEFINLIRKEKTLQFHTFLSKIFNNMIEKIIWDKYYDLGFDFDPKIQMIVTQAPKRNINEGDTITYISFI